MTSAKAGWALRWTRNPAGQASAGLVPARTTDGGRTWVDVTPPAARQMLTRTHAYAAFQAAGDRRAWLGVTVPRSGADCVTPHRTEVFGIGNGGRSWQSAPLRAPGTVRFLDFLNPADGWLMQDLGAAAGQDRIQLYRTSDGGRHWSRIAATPPCGKTGTSHSGLPTDGSKTGISFATPAAGWLTADSFNLADSVLVTRDGGRRWAAQHLPLSSALCATYGCGVTPPQFFGPTGYLAIGRYPHPALLVTRDLGITWTWLRMPAGAGIYPQVRFFDPARGLIVPAGPQGSIGRVFYVTSNGGTTWTPIRQGMRFSQLGFAVDFVSPLTGFAWIEASDAVAPQPMYETSNGGRTWASFTSRLTG